MKRVIKSIGRFIFTHRKIRRFYNRYVKDRISLKLQSLLLVGDENFLTDDMKHMKGNENDSITT